MADTPDPMPSRNPSLDLSPQDELPTLTERQERILSLIVREYIRTGQPVGSKTLVERFDLGDQQRHRAQRDGACWRNTG